MSVRHALLALLSECPKYGLRLQQEFHANTGEVWPLNVGQVYTTLGRLERDGFVAAEEGAEGPQKLYGLTDAGTDELQRWLEEAPGAMPPPRDELVIKILVARTVRGVDLPTMLQVHRRHVLEVMQQYTRFKREARVDDVELAIVVDAELFRLEGVVRWLDSVEARAKGIVPKRRAVSGDVRASGPVELVEVDR
jgi:DNA-binding PadR family transcriptional regulator